MSSRVFCGLLESLQGNVTLTSLDLSHNELQHSLHTKEALRSFLKSNTGLRSLDLSYNRFTNETLKSIHLGLLENDGK
jgi:Leucine-rich repeat (LRR) protein